MYNHLVDEDTERPSVHCRGAAQVLDHFGAAMYSEHAWRRLLLRKTPSSKLAFRLEDLIGPGIRGAHLLSINDTPPGSIITGYPPG